VTADDDNADRWDCWWLAPGLPLTPGPTKPKGTPGHRMSTGFLYPSHGTFVVHRLLINAAASTLEARHLVRASNWSTPPSGPPCTASTFV
jgi:hypothetical protein